MLAGFSVTLAGLNDDNLQVYKHTLSSVMQLFVSNSKTKICTENYTMPRNRSAKYPIHLGDYHPFGKLKVLGLPIISPQYEFYLDTRIVFELAFLLLVALLVN